MLRNKLTAASIKGDGAGDDLALGHDPLGDVPDDRGLDDGGVAAVQVDVPGGQAEVVQVLG